MNIDEISDFTSPDELDSDYLKAIWFDLNGEWDEAHSIVQQLTTRHAMWIHAYLHRKEGDISNSKYWYRNAGKEYPGNIPFNEEVEIMLSELTKN